MTGVKIYTVKYILSPRKILQAQVIFTVHPFALHNTYKKLFDLLCTFLLYISIFDENLQFNCSVVLATLAPRVQGCAEQRVCKGARRERDQEVQV